uniref:Uncharacterized protein n=1 Tax=Lepeophtheirus salmonis TaxID=72036 RepID=A0A0K2TK35_LEPSM
MTRDIFELPVEQIFVVMRRLQKKILMPMEFY